MGEEFKGAVLLFGKGFLVVEAVEGGVAVADDGELGFVEQERCRG